MAEVRKLRNGYTTGTCAAAAAKAAAWMLISGQKTDRVRIITPKGTALDLEVLDIVRENSSVRCAIRKDSGDDPDVTNGMLIYAEVSCSDKSGIRIDGGEGIGRVTKKGLDQPVGAAAINSVPRAMIRENLEELCRTLDCPGGLAVVISAPGGEEIAKKTFNGRLGILGGISILGTSGIVEPMSEQALIDTIRVELKQKRANGAEYVLLTPGNYGLDYIKHSVPIDPDQAVMTSNFIGDALDCCRELAYKGVLLIGHIGKLVKLAGGMMNTHSRYGDCRMEILAAYAGLYGLHPEKIAEVLDCAVCDDALRIFYEENVLGPVMTHLIRRIRFMIDHRTNGAIESAVMVFSNQYGLLAQTENAERLLENIGKGGMV